MYAVHVEGVRSTLYEKQGGEMNDIESVVVTGASTGIGLATCKVLAEKGFRVFGTVRKQADADRLSEELGARFTPLRMDVTNDAEVQAAADTVKQALGNGRLCGLVNNAGIAVSGPALGLSMEELRWQLEVNLVAPLRVVQAFAPLLGTDGGRTGLPGRIVQISSVAGKIGPPFLGAYAASKHALEGLSESMRRELMLYGIDVITIGPGSVVTPIWDKAEAEDLGRFAGSDYEKIIARFSEYFIADGRRGLAPEAIGDAVYKALTVKRPKARYAVVPQRFKNWTLPRALPTRWLDALISKQLGLHK